MYVIFWDLKEEAATQSSYIVNCSLFHSHFPPPQIASELQLLDTISTFILCGLLEGANGCLHLEKFYQGAWIVPNGLP